MQEVFSITNLLLDVVTKEKSLSPSIRGARTEASADALRYRLDGPIPLNVCSFILFMLSFISASLFTC